ncbi:uncharacterized protein [Pagrus major]|uniref:uncharacterized protein n=1 Tax=Pagrus major TaxID=143350 RepID=UPI003CC8A112
MGLGQDMPLLWTTNIRGGLASPSLYSAKMSTTKDSRCEPRESVTEEPREEQVTLDEADSPGTPESGASQPEAPQCSTWSPPSLSDFQGAASVPSTSVAAAIKNCPHCGNAMDNTHMVYKGLIYCESREGSLLNGGKTLEEWLLARGVARTTSWRLHKRFWEMRHGKLSSKTARFCPKCGKVRRTPKLRRARCVMPVPKLRERRNQISARGSAESAARGSQGTRGTPLRAGPGRVSAPKATHRDAPWSSG